jgi:hypothetical protein
MYDRTMIQSEDTRPTTPRTRALPMRRQVVLRVWGFTAADVVCATTNAKQWYFASSWEIVEVIPSTGTPCPIPPRDPIALNQNALYDAAWAAYPAEHS